MQQLNFLAAGIYVVVQFYPWFKFYFPLFQTHYHTLQCPKQKKIKFEPRIKLNHNLYKISLNACLLRKVRVIVIQAAKIVTCMLTPMRCNKVFS